MSTIKVAINGFGRIGRLVFRQIYNMKGIDVVAINDLTSPATLAHLLKYDSAQGRFNETVTHTENAIIVNGHEVKIYAQKDPAQIPWGAHEVDVVIESTGFFTDRDKAAAHLEAGAPLVIVSAPSNGADATFVYGINHNDFDRSKHKVVSNASCTTNCLAPVAKVLHDNIGIVGGLMTTIHAYTNDQVLTDVYHSDLRRAPAAAMNMIPTKTGAAAAVGLVLPELNGKLDGLAVRVPTINVSMVDLTFVARRATSIEEVNQILKEASQGALKGVLAYSDGPLVSVDFNHDPASSTYDATLTKVSGRLVKVSSWYDNEWGFSNRMLDTTVALVNAR